jgi:futalosine hydrolase
MGLPEAFAAETWRLHEGPGGLDLVVSGIGKVNAAGAAARCVDPSRHDGLLSVGVAGALPGNQFTALLTVIAATSSVYADEGLATPDGFQDCAAMGFPLGPFAGSAIPADPLLLRELSAIADLAVPVATVSTCSGTDELARRVQERTGAVAEAMEGAAVAHVGSRLGLATGELRVISNTCGDRSSQRWDLKGALAALERVIGRLRQGRSGAWRGA